MKKYLFVFGILSFLISSYYFLLKHPLPERSGELKLPMLEKQVLVGYDKNGIPHIKATNKLDAYRSMGYVLGQHRLFQLDIQRRIATGRLSEILGKKTADYDKLNRGLGFRYFGEKFAAEKKWSEDTQQKLKAFLAGLNHSIENTPPSIEFRILKYTPDKFTIEDVIAFIGYMSFTFQEAFKQDPHILNLMQKLPKNKWEDLVNAYENDGPSLDKTKFSESESRRIPIIKNSPELIATQILKNALETHEAYGFELKGSNAWVVDGSLSQSGKPMLANDPHIAHSNPGVWFEASMEYGNKKIHGHFLSFIPFPILGWTDKLAWSLTMSELDDMDFFLIPKNEKGEYLGPKQKPLAVDVSTEVIHIKDEKETKLDLTITPYGPLLDVLLDNSSGNSVAGMWTFYSEKNQGVEGLSLLSEASNLEEFRSALSHLTAPGLSIAYADQENNIAWFTAGRTFERKKLARGTELRFASLENPPKLIDFSKNPHLINPPDGYIINANQRLSNAQIRSFPGYYQPSDRARMIKRHLNKQGKEFNLEHYRKILNDTEDWFYPQVKETFQKSMSYANHRLKPSSLKGIEQERQFANLQSYGFSIYRVWSRLLSYELLADELSEDVYNKFFRTPIRYNMFKKVSIAPDSPWWDNINTPMPESQEDILKIVGIKTVDFLENTLGKDQEKWIWGNLHTYEAVHPLGRVNPLNHFFNLGPYPMPGAYSTINAQSARNQWDSFKVNSGASTRRAIDLANSNWSLGILPHGNSGHRLDKFHNNQWQDYHKGKLQIRKLSFSDLNEKEIDSLIRFSP